MGKSSGPLRHAAEVGEGLGRSLRKREKVGVHLARDQFSVRAFIIFEKCPEKWPSLGEAATETDACALRGLDTGCGLEAGAGRGSDSGMVGIEGELVRGLGGDVERVLDPPVREELPGGRVWFFDSRSSSFTMSHDFASSGVSRRSCKVGGAATSKPIQQQTQKPKVLHIPRAKVLVIPCYLSKLTSKATTQL